MKTRILAVAAGLTLAVQAFAVPPPATNPGAPVVGTLPDTTGSLNLELVVADIVHISGLDSIDLGTYPGDGQPMSNAGSPEAFCVFRNGDGDYELTFESTNATVGGVHQMSNGAGGLIPYSVDFTDTAGTVTDLLSSSSPVTRSGGAVAATPDCDANTTNNASIVVSVDAVDLGAADPGTYADTITITVTAI
jgi:spore coat protein U-like protein